MRMAVDRDGLTRFVTGIEETEGVREVDVGEGSHLYLARTEQAS
jgi:hypothetical protein